MAVLPHFTQSFTRHRSTPFRSRYILLVIIILCIYFLFTPNNDDALYSRQQQIAQLPNPLHAVHETDKDSLDANSPLWHDKTTAHGDVPSVAESLEKQREEHMKAVALLNSPEQEAAPALPSSKVELETAQHDKAITVEAGIDAGAASGENKPMDENLAEILRVHDSGETIEELETKPVDKTLIDALDKAKAGVESALGAAAGVVASKVEAVVASASIPAAASQSAESATMVQTETKPPPKSVFADFDFLFAFGDSWTTTFFELTGAQPSRTNPLGNPALPKNGVTAPPEWLYYLTTHYNSSYLRTYNIARGAATIDRDVVPPHPGFAFTWTLKEQAADAFGLTYSRPTADIPWATANTLFAIWFGVVDIALLLDREEYTNDINARLLSSYLTSIETLYRFGARRFLLLNCPPLARMPGAQHQDISVPAVKDFNGRIKEVQKKFLEKYKGDIEAEMWVFDVHGLLEGIMDDPWTTEQTSNLKNTTENCWIYNPDANSPTQAWDRFDPECNIPYNEYFWANPLHPTYPVHEAIAAKVVSDCFAVKGERSGFCS